MNKRKYGKLAETKANDILFVLKISKIVEKPFSTLFK